MTSEHAASPSHKSRLVEVLVEDRELAPKDPDRFRHQDIVEQLADLAVQVKPPANIALYGPWGSGKSSIASHLEAELKRRGASVRFARYDAFKFAQLPLQRHFIRHLALQLNVRDEKFGRRLYEDTTTNDLILGSEADGRTRQVLGLLFQTVVILSVALAAAVAVTAAAAAVGAWVSENDSFGSNFADYLRNNTLGFLAPAGLLALFGALAGKKLSVTRGSSAPTSEDQFAATFNDLVSEALKAGVFERHCDRLVIFIDELDRCDGRTVVATLDSLRSFLDADRCVFIVAADQQVLETALTSHVRQATPSDPANPYYSAGSEYLDKTFHYQLAIPDLLPRRLSGFAAELVRDKAGLWSEISSVERVVSVLIPNHVRSPRRAKTLLNSFALLFELVRKRCEVGHIAGGAADRAEEIAVLACLRVEFPLFARELRQHPRLVEAARAVLRDPSQRPAPIPEDTWSLAKDFINGNRAIDVLLPSDAADPDTHRSADDDADDNGTPLLREAQAHQLKAYLRKTGYVPGPDRDLIHLESSGARFGIDAAEADALEDAASQADAAAVEAVLDRLGDQRYQGMLSLAESLDRDVPPLGHEADNLVSIVLALYASSRAQVGWDDNPHTTEVKGRFITAINSHARTYDLRAADLMGALALGLDSGGESGESLVTTVLDHEDAASHPPLVLLATSAYGELRAGHSADVVALASRGLTDSDLVRSTAETIAALPEQLAQELMEAAIPALAAHLEALLPDRTTPGEDPTDVDSDETDEAEQPDPEVFLKGATSALLDPFAGHPALIQRVASAVLRVNHAGIRHAVEAYLPDLPGDTGLVTYAPLSGALLDGAQFRAVQSVKRWLAIVDAADVADDDRNTAVDSLAVKAWTTLEKSDEEIPDYLDDFLVAIGRLLNAPLDVSSSLITRVSTSLTAPTSDAEAAIAMRRLGRLTALTQASVASGSAIASVLVVAAEATLASPPQPAATADGLVQHWTTSAATFIAHHASAADASRSIDALRASPWFLGTERAKAELCIAAETCERGEELTSPYDASEVATLVADHGAELDDVAAKWLRQFASTAAEGYPILDVLFARRPGPAAMVDIGEYASKLDPTQRLELIASEIRRSLQKDPRVDLLRVCRIDQLDDVLLTDVIIETFSAGSNMDHRRRLHEVWAEAKLTTPACRARLISEVLIPTAKAGIGGLDLVIRNVDLWRDPPHGTKGLLRDLLKLGDGDQKARLLKALIHAGLLREEKSFLGLGPRSYKDLD
jgi:hypothetical protein